MSTDRRPLLFVLLGSALLVTVVIHLSFIPQYFPDDVFMTGLALVAGWVTYTLVFYVAGRLQSSPRELPSMRTADIGIALFLVSLLLGAALDSFGFTPEAILEAYVVPAIGIYVGLALLGWSIGRRTEAINEIVKQ
ncbi:hypothetical protein [Natronorubrum bangense]|uniref:Uncharacterized protein n=2 Tax=Natronorubrum bangense TaxID=61858 RepID=L9WPP0_9EURY|nr:hypothetical protein [Natronorubrum bangense]ELY51357.1 hypothetical protein C494_03395 [Natronorubrum bangense JCM 10635]QCC54666.1 hypothetical protein DV706_09405 [Natronorubrum bangense]